MVNLHHQFAHVHHSTKAEIGQVNSEGLGRCPWELMKESLKITSGLNVVMLRFASSPQDIDIQYCRIWLKLSLGEAKKGEHVDMMLKAHIDSL